MEHVHRMSGMMWIRLTLLMTVLSLFALGCAGRRQELAGYWDMVPVEEPDRRPSEEETEEEPPRFTLELHRSGTFSLQMSDEPLSGTWHLNGDALTCRIEKVGGQEIGIPEGYDRTPEIVFAIGKDNKTLTEYHIMGQGGKVPGLYFTKRA